MEKVRASNSAKIRNGEMSWVWRKSKSGSEERLRLFLLER
jgi:hypothetical protein